MLEHVRFHHPPPPSALLYGYSPIIVRIFSDNNIIDIYSYRYLLVVGCRLGDRKMPAEIKKGGGAMTDKN